MSVPRLGVIVVTFNSADVILDCLESLLSSKGVRLDIYIVDNASRDNTLQVLENWASGDNPYQPPQDMPFHLKPAIKPISLGSGQHPSTGHQITVIETGLNGGFAYGVNAGLAALSQIAGIDRFWVLNPDSAVPEQTAQAFATAPVPPEGFSLMGGRVLYYDTPEIIQIDGGLINTKTGVTGNIGLGKQHKDVSAPDPKSLDFITGASMVASRKFYEAVGPMEENYFLYYEEVDWALRRKNLPLVYCAGGIVYHKAGTAIGSPTLGRPASPFSQYFKHRARLKFVRIWMKSRYPAAIAYSVAKAGQLVLKGYHREAWALLRGSFNRQPPLQVRNLLDDAAAEVAFSKGGKSE
ncbi:glycosyltransferase family 2 protein [Profundibacter sp.]